MNTGTHSKRIKVGGHSCPIFEIGRESTTVSSDGDKYHLYVYHALIDADEDLNAGVDGEQIEIDVGNGYRAFPADRILRIEQYPLMMESRRTDITEWVIAVGEPELARRALWDDLPPAVERELAYRCRPATYVDNRSGET